MLQKSVSFNLLTPNTTLGIEQLYIHGIYIEIPPGASLQTIAQLRISGTGQPLWQPNVAYNLNEFVT